MSLIIETDLKELLNRIDQKIDGIQKDIVDLKISTTELKGEVKTLETKIDGLSTRVQNKEFTSRAVLGGLLLIVLGGAAKMFNFIPPGN
jgi:predicted  nucleic acid-binding Zn-ribbon protein